MWRTVEGVRTLQGAEAKVIRAALKYAADMFDDPFIGDDVYESEIEVFDSLQRNQKLALLARVGKGLLQQDEPPPELTAINEATVAYLFDIVLLDIQEEIINAESDDDDSWSRRNKYRWRKLVVAAVNETHQPLPDEDEFPPIGHKCDDREAWEEELEHLKNGIFWDDDDD